ncbi:glycoside hydrolase [Methylobacterium sp. BTF04]|uniref:glycoside hydrolase n=1 Tax=Methylobacterium sp. BTF04 TaxID=2708300 RepID=UPI0013D77E0A|nr:glycoside hydrolase [Methylobacterium sp. BTF04]NEU15031.1 glycoside hydrolase [Methylobacterium sp. BTF04]
MTEAAAYVSARQGSPYTATEHCWNLVRETQRDLFGRDVPAVLIEGALNARELVRAFHGHTERQNWREVGQPQNGAIVLMHKPGAHARAIHAGTYLNLDLGGVFHTDEDHGVTFDSLFELTVRNWRTEFYVPIR